MAKENTGSVSVVTAAVGAAVTRVRRLKAVNEKEMMWTILLEVLCWYGESCAFLSWT